MKMNLRKIDSAAAVSKSPLGEVDGKPVTIFGQAYYKIENCDAIPSFFISIVSGYDHWLFISSNGGLSAGRQDADQAIFPYYTEDKITDNYDSTGSKTIFRVFNDNGYLLWEPFSNRQYGQYHLERNLYKNYLGTSLIFEEINHSLCLKFRYSWRTCERFGFIKTCWLEHTNLAGESLQVQILDGLQNILPANVTSNTQNTFSCLLDAYKRSELHQETGLGIFTLNSTLTDLAEPSESLLATTVFQVCLPDVKHLLSSRQLEDFRKGKDILQETEIRGARGAYFVYSQILIDPGKVKIWYLAADTNKDTADVVSLLQLLNTNSDPIIEVIEKDIQLNEMNLLSFIARADGLQLSSKTNRTTHHLSNVTFNIMRGGVFADQYMINSKDFSGYIRLHMKQAVEDHREFFASLPETIHLDELHKRLATESSPDLIRLGLTYLPLTFSRRHGDPSRPWNKFAIDIKNIDGSLKLNYEGNWRDIFQNWEALACSFPDFTEAMVFTFLCATTMDGYNPYRISISGLEWEVPEPANPWANIGYWGDHQVIYLVKLMELSTKVHPGRLDEFLTRPILSYANIPYRIRPYSRLIDNPYNTIDFDYELNDAIIEKCKVMGTDARLVHDNNGRIIHRSLAEKLITLLLVKLINFVPEGGIWMNTQRPEWNDANNALVGKGLSVVTLSYLRRYVQFCLHLFSQNNSGTFEISQEVAKLFIDENEILLRYQDKLKSSFSDEERRLVMDDLGLAGSNYRCQVYRESLSGKFTSVGKETFLSLLNLSLLYIDHTLQANRRQDDLFHTYNTLHFGEKTASIRHLQEMLEGQVSILSSGFLSAHESIRLLKSLHSSRLYRDDQDTYILYPDKHLPGFVSKNSLTTAQVNNLLLPKLLHEKGDKTLLVRDPGGIYHFSGKIRNINDVNRALNALLKNDDFFEVVNSEQDEIRLLFESVFKHNEFTGRSGTFFAYEGLGSIYWHMVSKLLLAVQETALRHQLDSQSSELGEIYHQICSGFGFNKSPRTFGAFPSDPYSHSPKGQGARQPGMTGAVKEEILARQAELGLEIKEGKLCFSKFLIDPAEILTTPETFIYLDLTNKSQALELNPGSLAFTICQVPIVITLGNKEYIKVTFAQKESKIFTGVQLDEETSQHIFKRDGFITLVEVFMQ